MQFDGITSRFSFDTRSRQREPVFAAGIESELDVVTETIAGQLGEPLFGGHPKKHRASVNYAGRLLDECPRGGSCG